MGRGIAEVAALAGLPVVLCKATGGDPETGLRAIEQAMERGVRRQKIDAAQRDAALARVRCTADLGELGGVGFVVESIVEAVGPKRALYRALEARLGDGAILATNTSSLSLGELAAGLREPARFVGLHFFSPVPAMKLVEIAAPSTTAAATVEAAEAMAARLGKIAVTTGDTPGFIVNRLLIPMLLDAMRLLEAGVAKAPAIDAAMKLGCGHPLGPLALADAIGLDVVLAIAEALQIAPPPVLARLVAAGHLGKKSGRGIWDYAVDPPGAPS